MRRTSPLVLFLLFTGLFTAPFAGQCLFQALFFTRLQIEGVALDLFNDVFGLHLALETAEGILQRFALLQSNFCQTKYTPKLTQ
jgi:hypothetical protein